MEIRKIKEEAQVVRHQKTVGGNTAERVGKVLEDITDYLEERLTTGTNEIEDGSITTPKIVDEAVTEIKISEGAVTESKLADYAVTGNKISEQAAVGSNEIEETLDDVFGVETE